MEDVEVVEHRAHRADGDACDLQRADLRLLDVFLLAAELHLGVHLDRDAGRVLTAIRPNEPYHLEILRESCDRFIFVDKGRLTHADSFAALVGDERVRAYLGRLADPAMTAPATAATR